MTTLEGPPLASADGVGALTLGGFLTEVCGRHAGNEALVLDDALLDGATVRWSYADLEHEARAVGASLLSLGLPAGGRVAILMGNRPEAVASFFAVALAGGVPVLLPTMSPGPELEYMLTVSECRVVLTQSELRGRALGAEVSTLLPRLPGVRAVAVVGPVARLSGTDGEPVAVPTLESWAALKSRGTSVGAGDLEAAARSAGPEDEGLITFSSGTTARPKGVVHAQRAPALQFWLQARVFGRTASTRLWTSLPMFWTAGLNTAMGATLAAGGCWVMQETFDPGAALRLMARERVTEPYTLPHQTAALAEHPDWESADLSSLRCVYGKSAFARHPKVSGDRSWNMPVAYGLSETCTSFASHSWDTPREVMRGSSGRLLAGNRLRILDPVTAEALGPGEVGELAISGPTLLSRYLNVDPAETFDRDGFFRTGDEGYFDEEGFVHWTGRRSEMIKTAGASVSPAEIEVALRACTPVKLARVVGIPDARLGQLVVLCAVLKDGAIASEEDIRSFLLERLSPYKVPRRVLFFEDGEVPMTSSDTKVRDAELLHLVEQRLGGSRSAGR